MFRKVHSSFFLFLLVLISGCATTTPKDYSAFREADPKAILIVPVVNRSVDVDAPDYFLATVSRPVAERGYYVFPVNLVKRLMEDDGLYDATMVHEADPRRLAEIFGADSLLYVTIERWDARYMILSTEVTVEFSYLLKDGATGQELWSNHEKIVYQPQAGSSGNLLADLIADAIVAAMTKANPQYVPLAQRANALAVIKPHCGLPAGPYDEDYCKDTDKF